MSFPGGGDALMDERFGRFNKEAWNSKIQAHDSTKLDAPVNPMQLLKRLSFSENLSWECIGFLKQLMPKILDSANSLGLKLRSADYLIVFQDRKAYEKETGAPLAARVPLPASRLDQDPTTRQYTITVILEEPLQSKDLLINLTRTLFSKLFGDIYLKEQILNHKFYKECASSTLKQLTAGSSEKLEVIGLVPFDSDALKNHCEPFSKPQRGRKKTPPKTLLVGEWRRKLEKDLLNRMEKEGLEQIFEDFVEFFRQHPKDVVNSAITAIETFNDQVRFILPHEQKGYKQFKADNPTHFIRAAANKLEELIALSGFVDDVLGLLKEAQDAEALQQLKKEAQASARQLKTKRKVKVFLVPDYPLSPTQKKQQRKFPLFLMKQIASEVPIQNWAKEIKKLEKRYESSIYQKLFEALLLSAKFMEAHLQEEQQKGSIEAFKKSKNQSRLNQLAHVLRFRLPALKEMRAGLGVILDCSEATQLQQRHQKFPLVPFRRAWSYFISSLLTVHHYKLLSQSGARSGREAGKKADTTSEGFSYKWNMGKYQRSIELFTEKQVQKNINQFHIVQLFFLIYKKDLEKDLEKNSEAHSEAHSVAFLLYMLQSPQMLLRFVLHQMMAPLTQTGTKQSLPERIEQLPKHCDTLIHVYEERIQESV